jgi:hypothetical protein
LVSSRSSTFGPGSRHQPDHERRTAVGDKYAFSTLAKPHYQHAYVLYLSLSTHPEE